MKKTFLIAIFLMVNLLLRAQPDSTRKVTILFVGNSYTYMYDMPGILGDMIDSTRCDSIYIPEVRIMRVVHGSYTLKKHWDEDRKDIEDSLKLARKNNGRIILVLQEHSQGTLTPASRDRFREYAGRFNDMARSFGARVVFFQTWGRRASFTRDGDPRRTIDQFMYREVVQGDTTVLDERVTSANKGISRTYHEVAEELGAGVAPCGEAFAEAIRRGIFVHRLSETYGSHPNPIGSYLVACVMFGTLLDIPPEDIPDNTYSYVWPTLARRLQAIAGEAVAGNLEP